jgi:hypothetical protein
MGASVSHNREISRANGHVPMHFLYGIHNRKDKGLTGSPRPGTFSKSGSHNKSGSHEEDRQLFPREGPCAEDPVRWVARVQRELLSTEPMLETNPKHLDIGGRKLSAGAGLK